MTIIIIWNYCVFYETPCRTIWHYSTRLLKLSSQHNYRGQTCLTSNSEPIWKRRNRNKKWQDCNFTGFPACFDPIHNLHVPVMIFFWLWKDKFAYIANTHSPESSDWSVSKLWFPMHILVKDFVGFHWVSYFDGLMLLTVAILLTCKASGWVNINWKYNLFIIVIWQN